MKTEGATVEDRRVANLDRRGLVWAVFAALLVFILVKLRVSDVPYSDPGFVIDFFDTEVQVSVGLLLVTAAFFPWGRLGFRWPSRGPIRQLWPLAVLMATALGAWIVARAALPDGATADNEAALLTLRTTLLVGLNEEWIFRGLVLAALSRWMGLRRGALVSLLLFGGFHLLNIAAGVPAVFELIQVAITILVGSSFLLCAIGTRSLWIPVLAHAFYDFAVLDIGRLTLQGGSRVPALVLMSVGLLIGVSNLFTLSRLEGKEPYGE